MADLSDVEEAIAQQVVNSLYPLGPDQPSSIGYPCRVFRGWPHAGGLSADLAAGRINVAIFAASDPGNVTTRFSSEPETLVSPTSLRWLTNQNTITLQGEPQASSLVGVQVNSATYVYRVIEGDSLDLIAANMASLISKDHVVELSGHHIHFPFASQVIGRVAATASVRRELRRQEHDIKISCWCPHPAARDAVVSRVDSDLARLTFLALPDNSQGRLTYKGTNVYDQSQNAMLFRRDITVSVEYSTISTEAGTPMVFGSLGINAIQTAI